MAKPDSSTTTTPLGMEELFPLVYEELRRLARQKMSFERPGHTLQPTALVHEAYARLSKTHGQAWKSRRHFFAAAAEAMRRVLIDAARRKKSERRGGGLERAELDGSDLPAPSQPEELIALDAALEEFAKREPEKAELVKLKFFAGLTTAATATVLGISEPTVKRHWTYARAWLVRAMQRQADR